MSICLWVWPGPDRPELKPNVLNQADIVTIHGQLHPLDVTRMAQQLGLSEAELTEFMRKIKAEDRDGVDVRPYLVFIKKSHELFFVPPLPPRPEPAPAAILARR